MSMFFNRLHKSSLQVCRFHIAGLNNKEKMKLINIYSRLILQKRYLVNIGAGAMPGKRDFFA